jgi:hypothetical protein
LGKRALRVITMNIPSSAAKGRGRVQLAFHVMFVLLRLRALAGLPAIGKGCNAGNADTTMHQSGSGIRTAGIGGRRKRGGGGGGGSARASCRGTEGSSDPPYTHVQTQRRWVRSIIFRSLRARSAFGGAEGTTGRAVDASVSVCRARREARVCAFGRRRVTKTNHRHLLNRRIAFAGGGVCVFVKLMRR